MRSMRYQSEISWLQRDGHHLNKKLTASRSSEHPLVRGKSVKTFRWDHRLQRQNLIVVQKLHHQQYHCFDRTFLGKFKVEVRGPVGKNKRVPLL